MMWRLIEQADEFLQKHFDRGMHWVMRTCGVTKGFIRRVIWQAQVALALLLLALAICLPGPTPVMETIMRSIGLLFCLLELSAWTRKDREAEARGLFNPWDWHDVLPSKVVLAITQLSVAIIGIDSFKVYGNWMCLWLWLIHLYLQGTSPNVPPRKVKEKKRLSVLQPNSAH